AVRQDPTSGKLPIYHVFVGAEEHWFTRREDLDNFVAQHEQETGEELTVGDGVHPAGVAAPAEAPGTETTNGHPRTARRLHIVELHEVRSINTHLADLAQMGFDIQSLLPQERTGREESRYTLRR